jgi:hypothetical protein
VPDEDVTVTDAVNVPVAEPDSGDILLKVVLVDLAVEEALICGV